jgi:hypothetical protein
MDRAFCLRLDEQLIQMGRVSQTCLFWPMSSPNWVEFGPPINIDHHSLTHSPPFQVCKPLYSPRHHCPPIHGCYRRPLTPLPVGGRPSAAVWPQGLKQTPLSSPGFLQVPLPPESKTLLGKVGFKAWSRILWAQVDFVGWDTQTCLLVVAHMTWLANLPAQVGTNSTFIIPCKLVTYMLLKCISGLY